MKKLTKILAPIFTFATIAPMPLVAVACNKSDSVGYKLTYVNSYKDSERAQLGTARFTADVEKLVPNQEATITVTLDKFSHLNKQSGKMFRIFQTNELEKQPGLLQEGVDYTVSHDDTKPLIYTIKFSAVQTQAINHDMTIQLNASYEKVELPVTFDNVDKLGNSLSRTYTYNPYVVWDFSFLAMPKYMNVGYDVYEDTLTQAKVYGVKGANKTEITNLTKEKVLAYFKVQNTSELYPSRSHYIKVSIPMTELFSESSGVYTAKYDSLKIEGTKGCGPRGEAGFITDFVINTKNCTFKETPTYKYDATAGAVLYTATLKADTGYTFNYDATAGQLKLPISSLRIQPKESVFKSLSLKENASTGEIKLSDAYWYEDPSTEPTDFDYFVQEALSDKYPKLQYWMKFEVNGAKDELTIKINVNNLIKYTQLPTGLITRGDKITDYVAGSIDFMDYLSLDVHANEQ